MHNLHIVLFLVNLLIFRPTLGWPQPAALFSTPFQSAASPLLTRSTAWLEATSVDPEDDDDEVEVKHLTTADYKGQNYVMVQNLSLDYLSAAKYCAHEFADTMHLLSVESDQEWETVSKVFGGEKPTGIWLGGGIQQTNSRIFVLQWLSGRPFTYHRFSTPERRRWSTEWQVGSHGCIVGDLTRDGVGNWTAELSPCKTARMFICKMSSGDDNQHTQTPTSAELETQVVGESMHPPNRWQDVLNTFFSQPRVVIGHHVPFGFSGIPWWQRPMSNWNAIDQHAVVHSQKFSQPKEAINVQRTQPTTPSPSMTVIEQKPRKTANSNGHSASYEKTVKEQQMDVDNKQSGLQHPVADSTTVKQNEKHANKTTEGNKRITSEKIHEKAKPTRPRFKVIKAKHTQGVTSPPSVGTTEAETEGMETDALPAQPLWTFNNPAFMAENTL